LADDGERLSDEVARLAYLRTVQDWILKPQLKTVAGVADIDSLGGYEKQYVVEPDPAELVHYEISYSDIAKALQAANLAVGANYVQRGGEAYLLRADARIKSIDEIGRAVIATRRSVPVTINDVAKVRIGGQFRTGAASKNGREVVIGTALMLTGETAGPWQRRFAKNFWRFATIYPLASSRTCSSIGRSSSMRPSRP
jgi:heavy metal efflux system protein